MFPIDEPIQPPIPREVGSLGRHFIGGFDKALPSSSRKEGIAPFFPRHGSAGNRILIVSEERRIRARSGFEMTTVGLPSTLVPSHRRERSGEAEIRSEAK